MSPPLSNIRLMLSPTAENSRLNSDSSRSARSDTDKVGNLDKGSRLSLPILKPGFSRKKPETLIWVRRESERSFNLTIESASIRYEPQLGHSKTISALGEPLS